LFSWSFLFFGHPEHSEGSYLAASQLYKILRYRSE